MAADVSRGSQVHQVFQIGRAQIEPVKRLISAKAKPDFDAGQRNLVPGFAFSRKNHDAANDRCAESGERAKERRHVNIEDALNLALLNIPSRHE